MAYNTTIIPGMHPKLKDIHKGDFFIFHGNMGTNLYQRIGLEADSPSNHEVVASLGPDHFGYAYLPLNADVRWVKVKIEAQYA